MSKVAFVSKCPSLIYPERPVHQLSKVGQPFLAVRLPRINTTIDFYHPHFHQLTNPSSRNSFLLSSIQNTGGMGSPQLVFPNGDTGRSGFQTISCVFRHLQALCLAGKTQVLLFQANPNSFCKTPGVGCASQWHRHFSLCSDEQ